MHEVTSCTAYFFLTYIFYFFTSQSEMLLYRMKQNETTHGETVRRQMEDLKDCQMKLEKILEE